MARPEELEAIAEAGRQVVRDGLADGSIPPLPEEVVAMLREAGCPTATRTKAAS